MKTHAGSLPLFLGQKRRWAGSGRPVVLLTLHDNGYVTYGSDPLEVVADGYSLLGCRDGREVQAWPVVR